MINNSKPLPFCFFGSFTNNENSPECVVRNCTIRMTRILIPKELCRNLCKEVYIMLSIRAKYNLRSNPITLTEVSDNFYECEIDFTFSIKYCHYFRRKFNLLSICLQRRRTYNNKVIAGYKTIALHVVDMAWIIQTGEPSTIRLSTKIDKNLKVTLDISTFTSLPPIRDKDDDISKQRQYSVADIVSTPSGSDCENSPKFFSSRSKNKRPLAERRRLHKVLGKLSITDEMRESILSLADKHGDNLSDVESFESCSSLEEDIDEYETNAAIKPTIKPYFQNRRISSDSSNASTGVEDKSEIHMNEQDAPDLSLLSNPTNIPTNCPSQGLDPINESVDDKFFEHLRTTINDDITHCLCDTNFNYHYFIVVLQDTYKDKNKLILLRHQLGSNFIILHNIAAIKQFFIAILSHLQNQINTSQNIVDVKICIVGKEDHLTYYIQELVQFNMPRLSEIISFVKFLFVPINIGRMCNYFFNINATYSALFNDALWPSICSENNLNDINTMINRIHSYIHETNNNKIDIPISEVSLKFISSTSSDEISIQQINIPFFREVSVGYIDIDLDFYDDITDVFYKTTLSPIALQKKNKKRNILQSNTNDDKLTIDYWIGSSVNVDKKDIKLSRKGSYQIAMIYFNEFNINQQQQSKIENLKLIIRKLKQLSLGDVKSKPKKKEDQMLINNINRILCSSKTQSICVNIDGYLWENVKYFSVIPTWSTNLKMISFTLPI